MYVYADIVILINFIMNTVILILTAYAAGIDFTWKRLLLAAVFGAIYALGGINPDLLIFYSMPAKLLVSLMIIVLAFGQRPFRTNLLLVGIFFVISFVLGGAVLGWLYFTQIGSPVLAASHFALSWGKLAAGSAFGVVLITLIARRMLGRMYRRQTIYHAQIEYGGRSTGITGILDTGNGLYSIIGRKPVVLVSRQAVARVLSQEVSEFLERYSPDTWLANLDECSDITWLGKVEVVPYQGVGSRNILLGFRPDNISVSTGAGLVQTANVIIAIYSGGFGGDGDCQALLHPALITEVNKTKAVGICALPGQ